jgi:ABC-2 type transport system permease protein
MCVFLFVLGWVFWVLVGELNAPRAKPVDADVFSFMFGGTYIYWVVLAAVTSALTMRLFAEERRSGTIESLMTAPVTDFQVVMSKYLAALSFLLFMWIPTVVYFIILSKYATVDYGVIMSGYVGTILLCMFLTAIGITISSLSRTQFVSFFVTFVIIIMLFSLSYMQTLVTPEWRAVYTYISVLQQFNAFPVGVLSSSSIVYFLSLTVFLLFCTVKSVESHKWR